MATEEEEEEEEEEEDLPWEQIFIPGSFLIPPRTSSLELRRQIYEK